MRGESEFGGDKAMEVGIFRPMLTDIFKKITRIVYLIQFEVLLTNYLKHIAELKNIIL